MKYKNLIFGNGYLGNRLGAYLKDSVVSSARINSLEDVEREIEKYNPDNIINCSGKTGRPNIDWCESNKAETHHSNVASRERMYL